ncbi:hypothetical protein [Pontibacter arcticus]|uniref:Uncharacterized protein n=1 Tax=Pontibacter arcticus TaxID=2080288 RepID=A0A364RIZ8_9BACT|nr:hypothetical protein [Pontibacter arcticus]RAU84218.1 hypothetical protein DP923_04020 [Pontibacter arcticus]
MELNEIVEKHREVYIKQLREFYEGRDEGIKEALLKLDTEESGLLFNLSRMDYLIRVNDEWKIEELSPDSYINHEPVVFENGKLTVELYPLFWHGCQFTIEDELGDYSYIEDWAKRWIDEEDTFKMNNEGLTGAIHSVSIPEQSKNILKFTVDFGTAPVECFMDLIKELESKDAGIVTIESHNLIEE